MLDCHWMCPVLFSQIKFNDFMIVLSCIMLEKSVVFVSKSLDRLSSCVIGVTALMRPFKWQHLLCPVLPESLIDVLEAPVPLIAGTLEIPT